MAILLTKQLSQCRTLTYLVYTISQVCEMILWSLAARLRIKHGVTSVLDAEPLAKRFCWYGQVFVGFFAIFAAVGGTILQLLGVYRTCVCQVSIMSQELFLSSLPPRLLLFTSHLFRSV